MNVEELYNNARSLHYDRGDSTAMISGITHRSHPTPDKRCFCENLSSPAFRNEVMNFFTDKLEKGEITRFKILPPDSYDNYYMLSVRFPDE